MNRVHTVKPAVLRLVLAIGLLCGLGALLPAPRSNAAALPPSDWWLVLHNQCDDTLHWINQDGEFASIPRPVMPNEVAGSACRYRPMHISQDGRYYVGVAQLDNGRYGLGFFDLQTGNWLQIHQAQPNESIYLGDRYSSDVANRIAIGFANAVTAPRAWRVIVFDMTTGDVLETLQSDGPEIAGFVGGEFLATAPTRPHIVLLADDAGTGTYHVLIRFDSLEFATDPLGAVAWYPYGAPGVVQELISSPYTASDIDTLPNGYAIFSYNDPAYSSGPFVGVPPATITTNAIGMLKPTGPTDINPAPQLFFANGVHTLYYPQWAADGNIALFRASDGSTETVQWIRSGTAIAMTLTDPIAQILGVPTGFVYNSGSDLYFMDMANTSPTGPVYSDPMLSGSAAFVWATAFGNPPLALDNPAVPSGPLPIVPTVPPISPPPSTGQPDLYVSEFSLSPATPVQGQPVEVRVGVYNGGSAAVSGSFRIEWYPGEDYPAPACDWTLDGMAARGGRILTCTYAGYPSWYGSINTRVLVDTANAIAESNEVNNGYTLPISVSQPPAVGQPDLYVSEFSLSPATPVQGQPVEVRVGVYNGGNAAVSGNFRIEWYPGEDYPAPACDWTLDGLAARGGRILTCTYAGYPSWYGSINTRVLVDTANAIAESNEGNNGYTLPISVSQPPAVGQPDLYVSEFSLSPATPVQGQPVQVRVGVYNGGNAAVSGSFRIEWYAGENYPAPACDWTLDSMAARGGRILTCTYAGYPSWYGSINTKVLVDTANAIAESNEGNNSFTQAISVSRP
ncbi:MAG: hypothetical protein Kow0077_15650 [Anaerolineae bacterium]